MSADANNSVLPRLRRWLVAAAMFGAAWLLAYAGFIEELVDDIDRSEATLARLKDDYVNRRKQAANIEPLRAQLAEAERAFGKVQSAVPSSFDTQFVQLMRLARRNGLRIDHLQTEAESTVRDFYGEQVGRLRVTGPFHDLGAFASEVAEAGAIILLQDLRLESAPAGGVVSMDATLRAIRYLDADEVAEARRRAAAAKKGARK